MARISVSDEEVQLRKRARRRLVGAIALVGVVVLAVPLVLDHAPRTSTQHIDVQMPAPGDAVKQAAPPGADAVAGAPPSDIQAGQPGTRDIDAAASGPAAAAAEPTPADGAAPSAEAGPTASVPPAAQAHVEPPSVSNQEKAAAHAPESYAVPVIATTSPGKGRDFKQRLTKLKFPVYLEKTPDGAKTRVRVGPYSQREIAEQARQRLIKLGFDPGRVVRKGE